MSGSEDEFGDDFFDDDGDLADPTGAEVVEFEFTPEDVTPSMVSAGDVSGELVSPRSDGGRATTMRGMSLVSEGGANPRHDGYDDDEVVDEVINQYTDVHPDGESQHDQDGEPPEEVDDEDGMLGDLTAVEHAMDDTHIEPPSEVTRTVTDNQSDHEFSNVPRRGTDPKVSNMTIEAIMGQLDSNSDSDEDEKVDESELRPLSVMDTEKELRVSGYVEKKIEKLNESKKRSAIIRRRFQEFEEELDFLRPGSFQIDENVPIELQFSEISTKMDSEIKRIFEQSVYEKWDRLERQKADHSRVHRKEIDASIDTTDQTVDAADTTQSTEVEATIEERMEQFREDGIYNYKARQETRRHPTKDVIPVLISDIIVLPEAPPVVQDIIDRARTYHNSKHFKLSVDSFIEARMKWKSVVRPAMLPPIVEYILLLSVAQVYVSAGRDDLALGAYLEVRAILLDEGLDQGRDMSYVYAGIGNICYHIKKYDAAMSFFDHAYEARVTIGKSHPDVISLVHNIACCMEMTSDHAEAAYLFENTHERFKAILGVEHPRATISLKNLRCGKLKTFDLHPQYGPGVSVTLNLVKPRFNPGLNLTNQHRGKKQEKGKLGRDLAMGKNRKLRGVPPLVEKYI